MNCEPRQSLNEIYSFDVKSLQFVHVNHGARSNLGYTMEELRGMTPLDIKPQHTPVSFAELVAPLLDGTLNYIEFTTVHRRKDGSEYPVEVHLETSVLGEPLLQIKVIDTGIGIAEDQIENLFLPLTQADSSVTRQFGGTGLGLAICKRPAENAEAPLHNRRILLAEDGPDNQRLISFILEKAGAKVTFAENGQIALDLATAASVAGKAFDVILMDMQMPVLDGYAATRQLREAGYTAPIIALTAHAMKHDRQKCLDAGCDDYTTKPIDRQTLVELVRKHATRRLSMANR